MRRSHLRKVVNEEAPEFVEMVQEDLVESSLPGDVAVRTDHAADAGLDVDPGSINPEALDADDLTVEQVLELAKIGARSLQKPQGTVE
jgi:hypothetical protein